MRIIIDIRLLAKGGVSGIEEYTRSLVSQIIRFSEDELVLFYNGLSKSALPPEWLQNPKVTVIDRHIPNRLLDLAARACGVPKIEMFARGQAVWSPHFNLIATRLPRVVTFHDLSFLYHPDFFGRKQRLWHWLQLIAAQAKEAKAIIAVSEFTKSDLQHFFHIPEDKIHVIYSGVSAVFGVLPQGDASLLAVKEKYKLGRPFILSLGTIEPRKNLSALIAAYTLARSRGELANIELIIAGARGWLAEEVFKGRARSPFRHAIRFLGQVEPKERPALYNLASIFVYPSFFEGFGFPPLEAQASGVPVIASNRTSLPEILGNSAKLIDPWEVEKLADALSELSTSSETRAELVRSGLTNVLRFSWSKAAKETLSVLRTVAQG